MLLNVFIIAPVVHGSSRGPEPPSHYAIFFLELTLMLAMSALSGSGVLAAFTTTSKYPSLYWP